MSENCYEDKNKLICTKTTNVCVTLWSVFFNEFIMTHTQKITVPGAKIKNEMTVGYRIHMQ